MRKATAQNKIISSSLGGNQSQNAPKIYFFCCNEEGNLQEDVIALGEGLRELGIQFYSNCNYWRESAAGNDFLFRGDPEVTPDECDVVVVSYTWPLRVRKNGLPGNPDYFEVVRRRLPSGLFRKGRKYQTVYMDHHDGHRTVSWEPEFREFDVIFRCKLNRRAWHPPNFRPWALGLNNRILAATSDATPFAMRRKSTLINFGASHPFPHGVRKLASTRFEPLIEKILTIDRTTDDLSREPSEPYDLLMWRQTGQRYSRSYYERLKQSQTVACFCGELVPPSPFRNPERYLAGGNRAKLWRVFYELFGSFDPRPRRSIQWDSFRFWESLAAGCTAFNIDLELYGVALPVMPINWKHYIGLDFKRIKECIDRLCADPAVLEQVGAEGRRWAIENYSPRATAERFLREMMS